MLVTPSAVYAAERSVCGVYMASKPFETSSLLARDACKVSAFALAGRSLFWTTAPLVTKEDPEPKGTLAYVAALGSSPVIVDATLERPRGLAVLDETV
jgi:hypothetical protein